MQKKCISCMSRNTSDNHQALQTKLAKDSLGSRILWLAVVRRLPAVLCNGYVKSLVGFAGAV